MRAVELTDASVQEKKLNKMPMSISIPRRPQPIECASALTGASLSASDMPLPSNPSTTTYAITMKNAPATSTLCTTERGMDLSGSFASEPSDVELSKPEKPNTTSTTPASAPLGGAPSRLSWCGSTANPHAVPDERAVAAM